MSENKYVLKIYASKMEFESAKTEILDILSKEQNFTISLFLDQSKYVKYCESVDKLKKIISKMYIYIKTMKYTQSSYTTYNQYQELALKVSEFIKNLHYVEALNVTKLKKIMFTSKYQHFANRILDIKAINSSDFLLVKELDYDIEFINDNIKINDFNLLKLLNRKSKLRANLLGYDNLLQQKLIENKIVDEYESKRFIDIMMRFTNEAFDSLQHLNLKHRNTKLTSEFDYTLQNFTLEKLFESTNSNINEVFEIISQRIIINDDFNECLSDPSIDDIILYKNQNTFISFVELLRSCSISIHNQYSKYFNVYEYASVNEYEQQANFYFMLLVCDVLLTFMVEDDQINKIHNQVTKILVDSLTYATSQINMSISFSQTANKQLWIEAQNKFNFDEVFIDEQNCDSYLIAKASDNLDGIKVLVGLISGIRMFQAFDKDAELIDVIENYYKMGSQNTLKFNLSKMNIDILNYGEFENMLTFLEKR